MAWYGQANRRLIREELSECRVGGCRERRASSLGIGDDCAIVRPRGAAEDLLVHDRHADRRTSLSPRHASGPEDVGWKALARGLSDIAAMGGEPRFCLLSLALPEWADARWVDGFYDGLLALAGRAGTPLIGGDLAGPIR